MQVILVLLHTRFVKFGLVGGLVALMGGGILYTLVDILSIEKNVAYFAQALVSLQLNFGLNSRFTWVDRRSQNGGFWSRWVKFHTAKILSVALSQVLFALLTAVGVHHMLVYALSIILVMGFNYYTNDRFVFSSTKLGEEGDLMSHQETYRKNERYAEFLAKRRADLYTKYVDALHPTKPGMRVLDVGCGIGQVVRRLTEAGFEAYGVDVSEPNIRKAMQFSEHCQLYDGRRLPFPAQYFARVGALNVLEHVEEPEAFIAELVRVTKIGGLLVLSSPNFFRVIGFRDYHPKMRGLANKWRNWWRLCKKWQQMRSTPDAVRFDRMKPIVKEPFTPDDDAIVATNSLEMKFFLERLGCVVESVACTDRYVAKPIDFLLNLTPLRYLMFNAFVVTRRIKKEAWNEWDCVSRHPRT